MYFVFSLFALLLWSGSDIFTKIGSKQDDKLSEWKVIFFVGLIMGIHAVITLTVSNVFVLDSVPDFLLPLIYTDFTALDFFKYLPIAFIYILAMVFGYLGLRYIELSISSPICNSSGSLALVICLIIGIAELDVLSTVGVILITLGIILLSIVEYSEDEKIKLLRQEKSKNKYTKSIIALLIPIVYLILDALGTVGDQVVSEFELFDISEYASNTAFELTFLCFSVFAFIFVKFIKKEKITGDVKSCKKLVLGGICETLGQAFYMTVMFSDFSAGMPMISAYCVLSVVWGRIFLKEKLSFKHYIAIILTFIGIIILGIFSPV